jgi:protein TonB
VAHAGLAAYLFHTRFATPGAVETPTLAISVNLETSDALDALKESAAREAASSAAANAGSPGQAAPEQPKPEPAKLAEPKAKAAPPPDKADAKQESPVEEPSAQSGPASEAAPKPAADADKGNALALQQADEKADEQPRGEAQDAAPAQPPAAASAPEEALASEQRRRQTELVRAAGRAKKAEHAKQAEARRRATRIRVARQARKKPAPSGSKAAARGQQKTRAAAAQISASQGAMRDYGAEIRALIARNRPDGARGGARVVVGFSLDASGGLLSARIQQSSGDSAFDERALEAVRKTSPFPAAPENATPAQLVFDVAFQCC